MKRILMNENIRKDSFLVPPAAKSADTRATPLFCAKKTQA
jgi:hypothetical protein